MPENVRGAEALALRQSSACAAVAPSRIAMATTSVPATVPAVAEPEPLDAPADLPRPSIGGTWVGAIPELRYRMTRAGDVVHPDTMESVRSKVVGDFVDKVRAWTAVEPRGRELWIDSDGAVGGFIGAAPRLLGYLGPDPEGDIARGFFTPHFYAVDGDEIVEGAYYTRADLAAAVSSGEVVLPGGASIARHLIERWLTAR